MTTEQACALGDEFRRRAAEARQARETSVAFAWDTAAALLADAESRSLIGDFTPGNARPALTSGEGRKTGRAPLSKP